MPHVIVEYSQVLANQLNIRALLADLHDALGREESVDPARIKSRAVFLTTYMVGHDTPDATMIHIAVKLMPRPVETARRIAQDMQDIARRHAAILTHDCAITAEIVTLDPDTYRP